MARITLNPDDRTRFEKVRGIKKPKARIPKYGTSKPTKISADKRTVKAVILTRIDAVRATK